VEIRILADDELELTQILWSQAFRHGARDSERLEKWRANVYPGSYCCGAWDEGGLQSVLLVNDFRVHFGADTVYDMGGIGGVATLPAARGKGYAGKLLTFMLEQMHEHKQPLSTLFPFSWKFYQQYGYEWVGIQREYTIKTASLPNSDETQYVRAARAGDTAALVGCYTHYAHGYRGLLKRKDNKWSGLLEDEPGQYTFTFVYERDGKIEGYLMYRDGTEKKTDLREFICTSLRAYRGLLGLLRRHEMQTETFQWEAPNNDPLWNIYYHWDIETKTKPVVQARIVAVAAAFNDWRPVTQQSGSATFLLQDANCAWNTGTWRVNYEGGRTAIQRTNNAPQVSLDIQALSQAFYGYPTLPILRDAGRITVHDEKGMNALHTLLDGLLPYTNDGF